MNLKKFVISKKNHFMEGKVLMHKLEHPLNTRNHAVNVYFAGVHSQNLGIIKKILLIQDKRVSVALGFNSHNANREKFIWKIIAKK
jgi:hypothetical protein